MVVMWVAVAKPLQVEDHTQVGQVQKTDIIIPSVEKMILLKIQLWHS